MSSKITSLAPYSSTIIRVFSALLIGAVALLGFAAITSAESLTRQLQLGMSGADVKILQTFLAQDPTIYPEAIISSYFGTLTRAGVVKFQARNGIETVGRVGPVTLQAINGQLNPGLGTDFNAPKISNVSTSVSTSSATVSWTTNENAAGMVYYSTSWPSMTDSITDVTINGPVALTDSALRSSQNVTIQGLSANTTYYYVVYSRDAAGNVQTSWPATFKTN